MNSPIDLSEMLKGYAESASLSVRVFVKWWTTFSLREAHGLLSEFGWIGPTKLFFELGRDTFALDTDSHTWEVLSETPPASIGRFRIGGRQSAHSDVAVSYVLDGSSQQVGCWSPAPAGKPFDFYCFALLGDRVAVTVLGGEMRLFDLSQGKTLFEMFATSAHPVDDDRLLLANFSDLALVGPEGLLWRTERIFIDDLDILGVLEGLVAVQGCLAGDNGGAMVDLGDGSIRGQKSTFYIPLRTDAIIMLEGFAGVRSDPMVEVVMDHATASLYWLLESDEFDYSVYGRVLVDDEEYRLALAIRLLFNEILDKVPKLPDYAPIVDHQLFEAVAVLSGHLAEMMRKNGYHYAPRY